MCENVCCYFVFFVGGGREGGREADLKWEGFFFLLFLIVDNMELCVVVLLLLAFLSGAEEEEARRVVLFRGRLLSKAASDNRRSRLVITSFNFVMSIWQSVLGSSPSTISSIGPKVPPTTTLKGEYACVLDTALPLRRD